MDNIVIDSSSESDSDFSNESGGHSEREEEIYESENFMNHVNKKEYEANRNNIFTKDIEIIDIMVDSYDSSIINKNNYTYKLFSEDSSTGGHGTYKNIIGISLIRSSILQASSSLGYKLVDIIINEIPYNACIRNSNGAHIIDRVPTNTTANYIVEHEPIQSFNKNYFFPITLDSISILIRESSDSSSEYNSIHNSFIFRLTILKNLDLLR